MGFGKALLGIGGVAIAAVAGVAIMGGGEEQTTVNRVIDGDTIDVRTADGDKRVRLLNIDTPELARGGHPADCLAEDARDFLADLLPAGTAVRLEYDVERQDKYGRELAGVFLDDELVNARIAEEGLAAAMVVGENRKFYPPVQEAVDAAQQDRRGIFDVDPECFAVDGGPAATALSSSPTTTYGSGDEVAAIDKLLAGTAARRADLDAIEGGARNAFYGTYLVDRLNTILAERRAELDEAEERLHDERADAVEEAERDRKRQEEANRPTGEPARPNTADSADHPAPVNPAPANDAPAAPAPAAPAPAAPAPDTYTGCRAYGGNYALTSVDNQGRPYAKIDCSTKAQIG
ncbi:thermonuclease family protein [Corynebacterium confusum]|uniref:thermonuclease family protein n=1 Tax=Corynebacterium confusum TaxID=71254 RepID=UPI0025B2FBF2|nr:thermonuclease family protein [Corynebacterium confusum]WJY89136.1 Thermonuclease precursor [Corynebacterium confusum]